MSANSAEKATETFSEKLICESCGESFSCGSKIGKCWCFDIEIGEETPAELQAEFKNCLCPDCLAKRGIESDAAENLR